MAPGDTTVGTRLIVKIDMRPSAQGNQALEARSLDGPAEVIPWTLVVIPWTLVVIPWTLVVIPWTLVVIPWTLVVIPWTLVAGNGIFHREVVDLGRAPLWTLVARLAIIPWTLVAQTNSRIN
jgi:hypothetical protein